MANVSLNPKSLSPISHPSRMAEFHGKNRAGARVISRYDEGEAKVFDRNSAILTDEQEFPNVYIASRLEIGSEFKKDR